MRIDAGFAADVVSAAIRSGAEEAEIFMKSSKSLSVEIKDQSVESLKSSASFGYSVRIIRDKRLGFSFSTDPGERDQVVKSAIEAARFSDQDIYLSLPEAGIAADVEVRDPLLEKMEEEAAIRSIMLLERSVYAEDPRVKKVRKASGSFSYSETAIASSKSVNLKYTSTSCSAQVSAVAEEGGESQIAWDFDASRFLGDLSFEEIGRGAAMRAVRLLGSRKIGGCKADIVLDNSVTVDFLGIFASSLSSEAVQKGKSLLAGKLGKKVVSTKINMKDSGLLRGRLGSSPVDDEGVPSRSKVLIGDGVLQGYLYNTYTAKKEGVVSTGNAMRGGFASLPSVGTSNFYLEPGAGSQVIGAEKIIGSIIKGLYVVDAMGVHTANPVTGDFSVGVTGLWIEGGEIKFPVKEAVISGNILDFFDKVEAVGNDLRFYGNIGAPSLIISSVDISA